jgi:alpha-L-arabinofuranosidase
VLRRSFLQTLPATAISAAPITIDPTPRFEISPWLYMQFMEPLGVTDSSVEAAWDYNIDDWRPDFVDAVKDLAPGVIRWGGLYSRYYKWREGTGPAAQRPWMRNYIWGGKETNRVGTDEFNELCRRTGSEPLYCVNFLADGEQRFKDRAGDANEAADWVAYAKTKLWQIGNETSYGKVTFTKDEAIRHTIDFARTMKQRDPSIKLIGWGDSGWAPDMARQAGEHIDLIAIHMMGQSPRRPDTVLKGNLYQYNPAQAWQELLELANQVETRLQQVEDSMQFPLAITEGHLSLRPGNSNPILTEWLSAPYHARSLNIYQRHGARVRIATAADFQGNRWTVNAVMLPTPGGRSYLLPVGSIARLFKRHNGTHGITVRNAPSSLDIAASRAGNKIFLHVANLEYSRPVEASFAVEGMAISGGRVLQIAPDNLRQAVSAEEPGVFQPREYPLDGASWRFPAGAVAAVELNIG